MRNVRLLGGAVATLFALFLLAGCATTTSTSSSLPSWQGLCRHEAIYAALVVRDDVGDDNVRIVSGSVDATTGHAQAQARINGKWEWLHAEGDKVHVSTQDPFTPETYSTVEDFEARQKVLVPQYKAWLTRLAPEIRNSIRNDYGSTLIK